MKINFLILFSFFNFFLTESFSQNSPRVPDNMVLNISSDVIPILQNEVDALHINDKYFQIFVDRVNIYFPIIERILREEEMPDDLKYLALQESALIPDAVSSSNAVGFWQFKKETAEDYGLIINDKIDERKNIVSSTRAASKYIKNSNFLFENWIFSIYSYYQGLNGAKAVVDTNSKNYNDNFSVYENRSFSSVKDLSKNLSIDRSELTSFNSWIKSDRIPRDKVYSFLIPEKKENVFKRTASIITDKIDDIIEEKFTSPVDEKILEVISKRTVKLNGLLAIIADSTDNIEKIINLYSLTKKSFLTFNDINNNHIIIPGIPYYLTKKRRRGKVQIYLRREDESLWEVSQLFGVQLTSLKKFNKENNSSRVLLKKRSIL